MYYILDIENNPPTVVAGVSFQTEEEACNWIDLSGSDCPACKYTIIQE